ncbi:hypothetical protein [Chitinilyticum piscinae]|uniref:Uncharacterized protein n=1 Tax=Chitinilyticum piscinae TaxID=2866724 RepID=A0A8J7FPK8_9NEIS|nr:hypothetical protein [Chitinilyticum piscinae]MBE9610816.1 hypothetical protein [Chitinilyticum piscinae]
MNYLLIGHLSDQTRHVRNARQTPPHHIKICTPDSNWMSQNMIHHTDVVWLARFIRHIVTQIARKIVSPVQALQGDKPTMPQLLASILAIAAVISLQQGTSARAAT